MPNRNTRLPGPLIYAVCERFLKKPDPKTGEKWTAHSLAKWLSARGYKTNREQIFPIIRQAIDHGYLELRPPREFVLGSRLSTQFPLMPADTRILDVRPPTVVDNLAESAAEVVMGLIQKVGDERTTEHQRVHVGFGAGETTCRVAQALALRLRSEAMVPPLTIHALSSGFATSDPLTAPVAFFSYFTGLAHDIEYVGLFSAAVVKWKEYEDFKQLPGIRESFQEAEKLDVIVTSLAQAGDEHGLLNMFLNMEGGSQKGLEEHGHVGDVQWQPYSEKGPLDIDTGIRAVTIFDLQGLVSMASQPKKHVVLVAGPCVRCGESKAKALRPLLSVPELRVCNHLVTDVQTAKQILAT